MTHPAEAPVIAAPGQATTAPWPVPRPESPAAQHWRVPMLAAGRAAPPATFASHPDAPSPVQDAPAPGPSMNWPPAEGPFPETVREPLGATEPPLQRRSDGHRTPVAQVAPDADRAPTEVASIAQLAVSKALGTRQAAPGTSSEVRIGTITLQVHVAAPEPQLAQSSVQAAPPPTLAPPRLSWQRHYLRWS